MDDYPFISVKVVQLRMCVVSHARTQSPQVAFSTEVIIAVPDENAPEMQNFFSKLEENYNSTFGTNSSVNHCSSRN